MSVGSSIEWTDATWNPVVGCTRVSAGCDHCYAVTMTHRLEAMGKPKYAGLTVLNGRGDRHFNGVVRCEEDALSIPLRWRKPRRVFVNSMSDLFHCGVPFEFVDRVFAVMALTPQHTYQILTKRPEDIVVNEAKKIAADIAYEAFKIGNSGKQAEYLRHAKEDPRTMHGFAQYGCGWSEQPFADRIEPIIASALAARDRRIEALRIEMRRLIGLYNSPIAFDALARDDEAAKEKPHG